MLFEYLQSGGGKEFLGSFEEFVTEEYCQIFLQLAVLLDNGDTENVVGEFTVRTPVRAI